MFFFQAFEPIYKFKDCPAIQWIDRFFLQGGAGSTEPQIKPSYFPVNPGCLIGILGSL